MKGLFRLGGPAGGWRRPVDVPGQCLPGLPHLILSLAARARTIIHLRFLVVGGLNFVATNLTLQLLLLIPTLPTLVATSISQIVNGLVGFHLYGTRVFTTTTGEPADPRLVQRQGLRFLLLSLFLLAANTGGIQLVTAAGLSRNLGAIMMIPLLMVASFGGQRHWVFR